MDQAIEKKVAVPYRRHHNEVAHRSNYGWFFFRKFQGRLLKNFTSFRYLESNAEYKGMD